MKKVFSIMFCGTMLISSTCFAQNVNCSWYSMAGDYSDVISRNVRCAMNYAPSDPVQLLKSRWEALAIQRGQDIQIFNKAKQQLDEDNKDIKEIEKAISVLNGQ